MPQSLSKVYLHIVFSTKYRKRSIDDHIAPELFAYLGGICREMKCTALEVGGYRDHVHILAVLHRTVCQSDLLEEIKKRSSFWIKTKGEPYQFFYWQDGYAVFSVSPSKVDKVRHYIQTQEGHHKTQENYKTELIRHLDEYKMEYDERYMWE